MFLGRLLPVLDAKGMPIKISGAENLSLKKTAGFLPANEIVSK